MQIWILLAESLIRGLEAELAGLFSDTWKAIKEFISAFPNVLKMADVVARWATSLLGRALAAPIRGVAEMMIARLKDGRLHNRVLRLDDAVRMVSRGFEEALQFVTMTDETGLLGLICGILARRVFRFVKRVKLIAGLIAAKTEEEFVAIVIQSLKTRAYLFVWLALIVAAVGVVIVASVWVCFTCWCLVFIKSLESEYLLPQDSKRVWRKRGGLSRSNARRGPDLVGAQLLRGASSVPEA